MEEKDSRRKSLIVNIVLLAVLLVLIIVLVIAKFVLSPMKVSGESMMPTLRDGQLATLEKLVKKLWKSFKNKLKKLAFIALLN